MKTPIWIFALIIYALILTGAIGVTFFEDDLLLSSLAADTVFIHDTIIIDTGTVMRLSREKLAIIQRWDLIDDSLKLLTRSYSE